LFQSFIFNVYSINLHIICSTYEIRSTIRAENSNLSSNGYETTKGIYKCWWTHRFHKLYVYLSGDKAVKWMAHRFDCALPPRVLCVVNCQGPNVSTPHIPKNSRIAPLGPVLDSQSMLRVGGWLNNLNPDKFEKNPLIIPGTHHVSSLLIQYHHNHVQHQGRHYTKEQ
jgi:hypothetical protein